MSTSTQSLNLDDSVAEVAVEWIVRLSAEDPAERDEVRAGFEAWKRADPRNAAAAAGMERFIDNARSLGAGGKGLHSTGGDQASARAARAALGTVLEAPAGAAPRRKRRRAGGILVMAFAVLASGMLALRAFPPAALLADLRTTTGEQRHEVLADGTRITLGTASAVNYELSSDLRRVELVSGEILVDVARDPSRAFVVETADGRVRALGTRFIVRRDAGSTLLTMIESKTEAIPGGAAATGTEVDAGQLARLTSRGVELLGPVDPGLVEEAFLKRRLVVRDCPLPDVLDELARHRSGVIRYERSRIEGIRVSAVLPLDDPDRALRLLTTNFPQLRIRTATPWVVMVDTAP